MKLLKKSLALLIAITCMFSMLALTGFGAANASAEEVTEGGVLVDWTVTAPKASGWGYGGAKNVVADKDTFKPLNAVHMYDDVMFSSTDEKKQYQEAHLRAEGLEGKLSGIDTIEFYFKLNPGHELGSKVFLKIKGKETTDKWYRTHGVVLAANTVTKCSFKISEIYEDMNEQTFITEEQLAKIDAINVCTALWSNQDLGYTTDTITSDIYFGIGENSALPKIDNGPEETTVEQVDEAAALKVKEFLDKLPDPEATECTQAEFDILSDFLTAYVETNDATRAYMATEYGFSYDDYIAYLLAYDELVISDAENTQPTTADETTTAPTTAKGTSGTNDEKNPGTGAATPISMFIIAAAAGVVLCKSRKTK